MGLKKVEEWVVAASWVRWRVEEREERRPSRWQYTRVEVFQKTPKSEISFADCEV